MLASSGAQPLETCTRIWRKLGTGVFVKLTEMATEQREARRRRVSFKEDNGSVRNEMLTTDELASVLREASRLQGEERQKGMALNTLDDALTTAGELGIEERYVHAAASHVRAQRERLANLRAITRRRRSKVVAFAGLTVALTFGIALSADTEAGLAVLFGMSIALLIMTAKWFQAWLQEKYPETFEFAPESGECRVCGDSAAEKRGFYCTEHRRRKQSTETRVTTV